MPKEDDSDCTSNCAQSIYIVIGVKIIKLVVVNPSITLLRHVESVYMSVGVFIRVYVYNRSIRFRKMFNVVKETLPSKLILR